MPWSYEVKYWAKKVRTIEVYKTLDQAYKRAHALNKSSDRFSELNWSGPAIVVDCFSTHDVMRQFREIRNKPRQAVAVAKGGAL